MSLQNFNLLGLPAEIFKAIVVEIVRVRELKRALRLRLVSEVFEHELPEAICISGLLHNRRVVCFREWPYLRPYIEKRLVERRTENLTRLDAIRRIAERLVSQDGVESKYEDIALQLLDLASTTGAQSIYGLIGWKEYSNEDFEYDFLSAAVFINNMSLVKRLIDTEPREMTIFGEPALVAVKSGNLEALSVLLAAPAQQALLDMRFSMKLYEMAVTKKNLEIFEYLFDSRHLRSYEIMFGPHSRPLSTEEAKLVLHTSSPETFHEILTKLETRKLISEDGTWLRQLLKCAISHGWVNMTRHLLTFKDRDDIISMISRAFSETLLYRGVEGGNVEVVKVLLDLRYKTYNLELYIAAGAGNLPVLKALMDTRPDLNSRHARNVLYRAASKGFIDVVRFLLDAGLDPNTGDTSPLIGALESEHAEMFRLLVKRGGDVARIIPEVKQNANITALESMVELLGEYETLGNEIQSVPLSSDEVAGP